MISGENLTHTNIIHKIKTTYQENYQNNNVEIVESVLKDVIDLFAGKKKGFMKCDTGYHDLLHTLQVIPPFVGIIDGRNKSQSMPKISKKVFDLGIIAVLLHDTGYIKNEDDIEGTGGKYTFLHIERSITFAEHYLSQRGFEKKQISGVKNIIMCTGVIVNYDELPFHSEEERIAGYALGTADLLGQMSAPDYPEKLLLLYREFEESYHYEGMEKLQKKGIKIFSNADDLIRHTPSFYEIEVKKRLQKMGALYQYLPYHFKDSQNHFIEAIEENIKKIKIFSSPQ